MSATVGKIISLKEWKSQKQTPEKISWQSHKKLYLWLRLLMAVFGLGVFVIDVFWLKIYGLGWLGIIGLLPLFLSSFVYHTQSVELSTDEHLLTLKKQNKFHTKILKIHLDGIIAVEENLIQTPPKVTASLGHLSLYLKNGMIYHISLSDDATQNEHFKKIILSQMGSKSSNQWMQKNVS